MPKAKAYSGKLFNIKYIKTIYTDTGSSEASQAQGGGKYIDLDLLQINIQLKKIMQQSYPIVRERPWFKNFTAS